MQRAISPAETSKIRHNNLFPQAKSMAVYYNGNDAALAQDSVDTVEAPFRPERAISNPRPVFSDTALSSATPVSALGNVKSASKLPLHKMNGNSLGLQHFNRNIASLRNGKKAHASTRDGRND